MRRIAPLITLLLLLLPQAADASRSQESLFQDDADLVNASPARRDQTLDELKALGVDTIRANVRWNIYAPHPQSKTRPKFDATDPNAYPFLGAVDALVAGAQARGMTVLLTPTAPGPAWASNCKGSATTRRICRPKPGEFGKFVTALGRRYPTVHRWSIYNEPNQGGWLTPQYAKHGKHWIPEAPRIYRTLVAASTTALQKTGHGSDQILLGETAPIGRTSGSHTTRSLPPVDFYRELFCLDSHGRKLRGSAAKVRACTHFKRLAVTGVAHHPYTRGAGQSPTSRVGSHDITLRYISRLSTWLNRAAHQHRIKSGLPIWLTEYGFQTNPPDRYAGTSLGNQAKWINESDWMAWRNGRIRSVGQYEMRDEPNLVNFQTGLRFKSGKAKPAYNAYRLPIWPVQGKRGTKIWLQVRPESRLGAPQKITIQYRKTKKTKSYKTLKTLTVTNARGFVYLSTRVKAAYWRFNWNGHRNRTAGPA